MKGKNKKFLLAQSVNMWYKINIKEMVEIMPYSIDPKRSAQIV